MAYFNRTLFDDIRKTVYEYYEFLRSNSTLPEGTRYSFAEFQHTYVKKINKDIAVQELAQEYDGINPNQLIEQILILANAHYSKAYNEMNFIVDSYRTKDIKYRIYINAHPFFIDSIVAGLVALGNDKYCPRCKTPWVKKCTMCNKFFKILQRVCPDSSWPLAKWCQNCNVCYGHNPISRKFRYDVSHSTNEWWAIQELFTKNKLVFYLGDPIEDVHMWIHTLRAMPQSWFGKHIPRFTKMVSKGVGFARQPTAEMGVLSPERSVGVFMAHLDVWFIREVQRLLNYSDNNRLTIEPLIRNGRIVLDNQHLDYIAMKIYKDIEKYAEAIFQPFE